MSFEVKLFNFSKKENSTKRPSLNDGISFNCVLKEESGIINPSILLDIGLDDSPSQYNYAYIQAFGRYYWINDWMNEGKLWRVNLSCDVLATYKSQIGNANLYMLRASSEYDGTIIDKFYPTNTNVQHVVDEYDDIFSIFGDNRQGTFVIGVVNKIANYGSICYYALDKGSMRELLTYLMDDAISTTNGFNDLVYDASLQLQKCLIDPLSYIKTCTYIPIEFSRSHGLEVANLLIWSWDIMLSSGNHACMLLNPHLSKNINLEMDIRKHPQTNARGNYVNTSPYTTIDVLIPPFNTITLDTLKTQSGGTLDVNIRIDMPTGASIIEIYLDDVLLAHETQQVGTPIQLSQVYKDVIGATKSAVSTSASVIDTILNPSASGVANSINGVIDTAEKLNRPLQTSTSENGCLGLYEYPPKMFTQFQLIVDDDIAQNGRPLCKIRKPQNLNGYMMVQDADLDINATESELASIRSYLQGGFYYE